MFGVDLDMDLDLDLDFGVDFGGQCWWWGRYWSWDLTGHIEKGEKSSGGSVSQLISYVGDSKTGVHEKGGRSQGQSPQPTRRQPTLTAK